MEILEGTSSSCKNYMFNEYDLVKHDLEIRADERKKVVEELLEMLSHDLTLYTPHSFEYDNPDLRLYREREKITKDLRQKLTELKGE